MTFFREIEKILDSYENTKKIPNSQRNPEQKRAMLEIPQYLTSKYITELQ
jgi:hypothetical protein